MSDSDPTQEILLSLQASEQRSFASLRMTLGRKGPLQGQHQLAVLTLMVACSRTSVRARADHCRRLRRELGVRMPDFPYTPVNGRIKPLLDKIAQVGRPAKVDKKWLESVGFKASNDVALLRILKLSAAGWST